MKRNITLSLLIIFIFNISAYAWIKFTEEELAMEAPEWCSDADLIVLDNQVEYEMVKNTDGLGMNVYTKIRYKVMTDAGIDQSNFTLALRGSEKLIKLKGRTITPDGKKIKVKGSNIFEKVIYTGRKKNKKRKVKQIAFPEVTKGAILEVYYNIYTTNVYFLEPHYYDFDNLPTIFSRLDFKIPMGAEYYTLNVNANYYETNEEKGSIKTPTGPMPYYWCEMKNINPKHLVPYAPAEDYLRPHTHFLFTRFRNQYVNIPIVPDWKEACDMLENWVENFTEKDDGIDAILSSVENSDDKEELARSLFKWVADSIEYVDSRHCFEFGGDLSKVIEERKGRGMEKALLLKHLLDKSGMATKILIGTPMNEGPTLKNIPSLAQFSDYLIQLDLDGNVFYLDPTYEQTEFGVYPWYWYEGTMLLVDRKNPNFIKIPARQEKANELWDLNAYLSANGELHIDGHLSLNSSNYLRRLLTLRDIDEEKRIEYFLSRFLPDIKEEDVDSLNATIDKNNVFENDLNISFTLKNYAEVFENQLIINPNIIFREDYDLLPQDDDRQVDLQFSHPKTRTIKMTLHLPDGYECKESPVNEKNRNQSMGYFVSWYPTDEGKNINYQHTYSRKHWYFGKDRYNDLRNFFNALAAVDHKELVIQPVTVESSDN